MLIPNLRFEVKNQKLKMMKVTKEPNKILHKKLQEISEINKEIIKLYQEMKLVMIEAKGVGIAGNQVGKDMQIFVIDESLAQEHKVPQVYINSQITEYSKDTDVMEEGCLSMPDYWQPIKRSKKIKLKALDIEGNKVKIKAKGFLARVLQHETDHINGLLIHNRYKEQHK